MTKEIFKIGTAAILGLALIGLPAMAQAQRDDRRIDHRDKTRDEWKNIATVSGAAAILGLLTKDNTLAVAGGAGALYSLYRYDQDSRSSDRLARARAEYFKHDHFYRDGVRFDRRTVSRHGQKYYQFVRAPRDEQDWNRNDDHRHHSG